MLEHVFAPPVDAVCKLREARESLASEDYAALTSAARAELVTALLGEIERLGAEALRCVGQWDAGRDWADDGALSASSWLAHRAAMAKPAATRLVRTARLAFRNVRTGKALAAGDVSVPQVEVLAAVARDRERLDERDEDTLLDAAPSLTVDDFTTVARYWRSAADDELSRLDAFCAFEARSITIGTALDGRVVVQCSFDAEGAEIVSAALDAYDRPDPECSDGPVRTLGQRRADALVQICSEALGGARGARRHTPTIDGVIDLSRLGHGAPLDLLSRCEIVGIGPVPRVVIERMACDARVGRIVMRGRSAVLDVGRRTRVVPPRCGARSCTATATARSRAAPRRPSGATCTTAPTGWTGARRTSRTACSCAVGTT
jgi:hypothetical protein